MMIPLSAIDGLLALGITAVIPPSDRAFLHSLRDRPHLDGAVEATLEELGQFGRLRRDYGPKSNGHAPPEGSGFAPPEEELLADRDATVPPFDPVIDSRAPFATAKLFLESHFTADGASGCITPYQLALLKVE